MTGKVHNSEATTLSNPRKSWWGVVFLFLLCSMQGFAQEICDNGLDDDGDNLVDVFDPDCPCDNQTLLCQPTCEYAVPGGPLNFSTQWTSADTVPNYQTPLVADIDNDDVPEVIIMSSKNNVLAEPRRAKDLLIINGATGATELSIATPFMAWVGPDPYAVADIDGDGFGEIILASIDHTDNALADRRYLFCYEHTGALKWKSDVPYGYAGIARFGSSIGFADFNSDGIAEVYIYNQIFNALTGKLLAEGGSSGGKAIMTQQGWGDVANPVAANLTTSAGLELACGNTVYDVTITNTTGLAGNTMTAIVMAGQPDGYTSLADIDLDGNLDVVVAAEGSVATLYVWNPGNGTPSLIASTTFPNTGGNWIGVPFIGDMDKDCQPEIGVTRSRRVYALDYDGTAALSNKWTLVTTDASGFTGITMFDFNQDGTQELVYRDESNLRIIDGSGTTPTTVGTFSCTSGTGSEMPVVADVDGDGQAEICVSCAVNGISEGRVTVFEAAGQAWAPCRSIWNQFSYFNVNINNNLSIPLQQQQHQVQLSNATCPFFTCSENRPFNSFLSQATFLTQEGCPVYPASDIELSILNSTCNGSAEYNLSLLIENVGAAPSDSGYPIRFYAGNPFTTAAIPITVLVGPTGTLQDLNPGQSETIAYSLDIAALPKPFNLFVILNDDGAILPPFNFPLSTLPECNFADNVASISNINCCPFGDLTITGFSPSSATFCEGGSSDITVIATSTAGLNASVFTWTFPDNSVITGDTITADMGGTYSVTVKDNAQCLATSTIAITEIAQPTPAAAGNDQLICADTTALEGNIPGTGTGTWTLVSGTGTIVSPGSATSAVSGIAIGTSVFRWAILNGTECISEDTVSITRIDPPSIAVAGNDQAICIDVATLGADVPVIGIGTWSLVSGAATITDATSNTTTITSLGIGSNVLQWTVNNGVCPATTDQVTILRSADPSLAEAGSNQTICTPTAQLGATTLLVGTGQWSLISGTGIFTDTSDPASQISGLSLGANVFQWTVTNGTCAASTDQVEILRNELPSAAEVGPDQVICAASTTITATEPVIGNGAWTLMSGSGTIADASAATTTVSNLGAGPNVFMWTVSNGVCLPNTATVSITRDLPPDVALAGDDQQICATSTSLQGNSPAIGSGLWTVISGTATIDDPSNPSTGISALTPGTTILQWTISNGVCPATTDQVSILIDAPVSTPDAGTDFSVCAPTGILAAATPLVGTGLWTVESGTAVVTTPTSPTSGITGLTTGTSLLRWTISNGTCTAFDEVTVTRTLPPSQAIAGPDQQVCSSTAQFTATAPTSGTGTWTILTGTATFTNVNDPLDQVSDLSVGINTFLWTISSGVCPSSEDTVTIEVDANPINPDAGIDQQLCSDLATLNATPATVGNGLWTIISGSAVLDAPSDPQSALTNLSAGTNTLRWTITNGTCIAFDQVNIVRDLPPTAALAGDDQEVCQGQPVSLNATIPVIGTGIWSLLSGQGIPDDSTAAQTTVSGLQPGSTIFEWTVSNGVCASTNDQVTVLVNSNAFSALAGNDQTLCADTTRLTATPVSIGTGIWTLVSGAGVIQDVSNPETFISGLQPGANVFRWTVSNGNCPPVSDEVSIQVDTPPTDAQAGADQQVCSDNTTLNANTPNNGTGIWSVVSGAGSFGDVQNPTTALTAIGIGVNVFQWTISNGVCPSVNDQLVIIRDSLPVQANAGVDFSICNSDTATLAAIEPTPGTGVWTVLSGTGILEDATSPISSLSGLGAGINTFIWTVTTGNCLPTSDTVSIQNILPPSSANAGNDTTLCGTAVVLQAEIPAIGTGSWSSPSALVFNDINAANAEVSNLSPGQNILLWTVSNGICPASVDTVILAVDKNPITPNAGPDLSICADTVTLSAAAPSLGTGAWSILSGTLSLDDPASPSALASGVQSGTTVLRWTVTSGACIVFDDMQILRSDPPSAAFAGNDQQLCDSTTLLEATAPTVGTGVWSIISGSAVIADNANPTSAVSGISPGTTILRWTITSGACDDIFDEISLLRDIQPKTAQAGPDQSVCADTTQLAAIAAAGSGGSWTLISGSGILVQPDSATTAITGLGVGTNVFRWTLPAAGSCPEVWDEVSIERNVSPSPASAGEDASVCSSTFTLSANTPSNGTGVWLVIGGNGVLDDSLAATTSVSNLDVGNNVFEWRISNGSCPVETDEITITRGDTAFAGEDQIICDSSATLAALAPTSGTGSWSVVSGTGIFADSSDASTTVSGLSAGENSFQWTITGAACPDSTDQVIITRSCNTPPVITNDAFTMLEDSVLSGNLLNEFDFDPDSTTLTVDTTSVTGPEHGTVVIHPDGSFTYTPDENYYGIDTLVVTVCDSGTPLPVLCGQDTIFITIEPVNDPPVIINDTISVIPGGSVSDNLLDNDSDPEGTELTANTTPVSGPSHGEITINADGNFTYTPDTGFTGLDTVIVEVCDSGFPLPEECAQDTIFITVTGPTFTADAGPDQVICGFSTTLDAQAAIAPATGQWSIISGTAVLVDANSPTTTVNAISSDTLLFVWTVTQGGISLSDTMQIISNEPATPAFAGEDQSICGDASELQGNTPVNGTGSWSLYTGTGLLSDPASEVTGVTGLATGDNVFVWTITNGPCVSADTVIIRSFIQTQVTLSADTSVCPDVTELQLSATVQGTLSGTWSVQSGTASFSNDSLPQTTVSGLSAGANVLVYTIANGPCGSSDSITITLLTEAEAQCLKEEIFIPEGFSPDDDGSNDVFAIYGLKGQRVTLKVFNRWGNLVYESDNYGNDWNGTCTTGWILTGERLPESTYYYLVQIEGENETRKGYLTLWR